MSKENKLTEAIEEIAEETATEAIEEIAEELPGETIEAISSDAVAIAAIEADREIQIAEINADVATAQIEAESERENSWQENLADLQANMQTLSQTVADLQTQMMALSTPAPLMEAATELATMEAVEPEVNNLTLLSMSPETSETQTEVSLASEGEKPEAVASVTIRKKRRRI